MSKFTYSEDEQKINNVLNYQAHELKEIRIPDMTGVNQCILESEQLLESLGYAIIEPPKNTSASECKKIIIPSWDDLCLQAEQCVGANVTLESLFTDDELQSNELAVKRLNEEYNSLHRLDKFDIMICVVAGILSAIIDILLVGIPQKTPDGLNAGPLSNYVREWFDKKYPQEEMSKLANSKVSKVPYDAQDNRNTKIFVNGLSTYYHRLLSLGHDPILGFIFGVFDILNGTMTTIDKQGKFVIQLMENYEERKEQTIFSAIVKQLLHLKSDITTSMGLPVPLMSLFNFLQFGSIGEEEQTIAEIVQGMYYEGYDFIHFCSMSIPTMLNEVIVRIGYACKRIKEGHPVSESIPFSLNREKHPKLGSMLFIGHSIATAANAGKIYFSRNPMAINYTQWLSFAKYAYKQLKWVLLEKPRLKDEYVQSLLQQQFDHVYTQIDTTLNEYSEQFDIVFLD